MKSNTITKFLAFYKIARYRNSEMKFEVKVPKRLRNMSSSPFKSSKPNKTSLNGINSSYNSILKRDLIPSVSLINDIMPKRFRSRHIIGKHILQKLQIHSQFD